MAKRERTMDKRATLLAAVAAVCCLMAPAAVSADDVVVDADGTEAAEDAADAAEDADADAMDDADDAADEEDEDERPWSASGSVRMAVGQGTFASVANDSEFAGEIHDGAGAFNRVSMRMGAGASYSWDDYEFSGQFGVSQYLTAGGGAVRPYEGRIQDIQLSASRSSWEIADTGVSISPSLSGIIPTSRASQASTTITSLSAGIGVSKTFFDDLSLSYRLGGSRNFHRFTSPVMDVDEIGDDNALYRVDGEEAIVPGRFFAVPGINTAWGMSHSISASFRIGEVSVSTSYALQTGWTYPIAEDDELAHERQCAGRCAGQMTMGQLSASYRLTEHLSLSGGINTGNMPKTMDQKTFAFPFWNFEGAAANRSSMNLGIMGSY